MLYKDNYAENQNWVAEKCECVVVVVVVLVYSIRIRPSRDLELQQRLP